MGSSYSITNDTDEYIYVWDDVNMEVLIWSVGGAFIFIGAAVAAATKMAASAAAAATTAGSVTAGSVGSFATVGIIFQVQLNP